MYVRDQMTRNPICIDINSKISEVVDLMSEKNLHRIPVIQNGKLAGLVTEGQIAKKGPSKATSLSIFELNYLCLLYTSVPTAGTYPAICGTGTVLCPLRIRRSGFSGSLDQLASCSFGKSSCL